MNNPQLLMFLIGIAVVVIIAIALFAVSRRSRSEKLREHFGSEYDRAVNQTGSRTAAEDQLIARAEEAKQFDIRPLTAAERERFAVDWKKIEAHFVERPTTAVVEADELVELVMRTRGYPMADFEKHAELLSVKHPRVVEHYRAGHRVIDTHGRGAASTDIAQPVSAVREVDTTSGVRENVARDDRPGRGAV